MVRIRKVEIRNFRSIRTLDWAPSAGVNCLIGPGDSGKSTILDAIDLCLAARRTVSIADTDFHGLDVTQSISISLTVGGLPDALRSVEAYADFLRGFNPATGRVEDEPHKDWETVLTLDLTVASDLEPVWSLFSLRAQQEGLVRGLAWKDRLRLAPARLGNHPSSNLSWTRGSVLNRLSEERAASAELARAARDARSSFGDQAGRQLERTLKTVTDTANHLAWISSPRN
jgi:putative ATP-dependent endonuclease of OLD family